MVIRLCFYPQNRKKNILINGEFLGQLLEIQMKDKYLHPVLHVFPQVYGDFKLVILQKFGPGKKEGLKRGRRKETGKHL